MVAALAGAAAAVAIAVPVAHQARAAAPEGYANAAGATCRPWPSRRTRPLRPVVMETDNGDAVIWVVPDKKEQKKREEGEPTSEKPGDL